MKGLIADPPDPAARRVRRAPRPRPPAPAAAVVRAGRLRRRRRRTLGGGPARAGLDEMVDLLSRWIWSILDDALRSRGIELDPQVPLEQLTSGRAREARDEPTTRSPSEFGIEELSRRTGITVRSLRSYQSRKLLPPPEVRGRTGFYDQRHVARIELLKDLQSEGFTLDAIASMLDATGRSDADLLRFTRSVRSMFGATSGAIVTTADFTERFGAPPGAGPGPVEARRSLGLLREVGEDTYEELAPRLVAAGEKAVHTLGLDADEALDVVTSAAPPGGPGRRGLPRPLRHAGLDTVRRVRSAAGAVERRPADARRGPGPGHRGARRRLRDGDGRAHRRHLRPGADPRSPWRPDDPAESRPRHRRRFLPRRPSPPSDPRTYDRATPARVVALPYAGLGTRR